MSEAGRKGGLFTEQLNEVEANALALGAGCYGGDYPRLIYLKELGHVARLDLQILHIVRTE